jgi:hypothetical protein
MSEQVYRVKLKSAFFGDTMTMRVLDTNPEEAVKHALEVTFMREVVSVELETPTPEERSE